MAESMIKMLDEPALAEEMGLRGREVIKKHFSLSRHLDILSEVIKQSVYKKYNYKFLSHCLWIKIICSLYY